MNKINLSRFDTPIWGIKPHKNMALVPYVINQEKNTITVLCPASGVNFLYKTDTLKNIPD